MRQPPRPGGFDLAAALPQLRLDIREAERLINVLLCLTRNRLDRRRFGGFLRGAVIFIDAIQTPFVERELLVLSQPAQLDVMVFRAGEIKERRAKVFRWHDPQIDLQPADHAHADFARPLHDNLLHFGKFRECRRHGRPRRRVFQRTNQIQVSNGFPLPAQTAGDLRLLHSLLRAELFEQRLGDRQRVDNPHPPRRLGPQRNPLPDRFDFLLTDPLESRHRAAIQRLDEFFQPGDATLLPQQRDRFRPQPGDFQHRNQSRRNASRRLLKIHTVAGLNIFLDDRAARFADSFDLIDLSFFAQFPNVEGQIFEDPPDLGKCDRFELVLSLDFHDRRKVGEKIGQLIVQGHKRSLAEEWNGEIGDTQVNV